MKTRNLMLAALALFVLALPSCSTLKTSEQEEMVSQIQKEEATNPVPLPHGTWFDANGWDYDGLAAGD